MRWFLPASLALLAGCVYTPLQSHRLDGTPADPVGQPNTIYLQDGASAEGTAALVAAWAAFEQLTRELGRAPESAEEPAYGPCGPACGPLTRTLP